MKTLIKTSVILFLIVSSFTYSQSKKDQSKKNNSSRLNEQKVSKQNTIDLHQILNSIDINEQSLDYKVISSNSSYLELEFYPAFQTRNVNYNGTTFYDISFKYASLKNSGATGAPVIKCRRIPLFLPCEDNNTISVLSYDVKNINGINLCPVPGYRIKNLPYRSFEDMEQVYNKDQKYYNTNKFFPANIAELTVPHSIRENLLSNIILYPYQYNPVTEVLKQYSRIRVRITFGHSPIYLDRTRTPTEIELLKGSAINSNIAINWKNPSLNKQRKSSFIPYSVMNSGDWYKIEIKDDGYGTSDGIYKITKSFLTDGGINLSGVDPRKIKMFGNCGDMLPDDINQPRPCDLIEIPIYIEGESDGSFDNNDYILFYGRSVNNWKYDSISHRFSHNLNIYSSSNYYWLCLNTPGNGKRMQYVLSENSPNAFAPSSFTEKLFFEPEKTNLLNEGNVWFSEDISNGGSVVWNNTLNGLENNTNILYKIKPATRVMEGYENHVLIKEENSTMSDFYLHMTTVSGGWDNWVYTCDTNFILNSSQKTNGEQSSLRCSFYCTDPGGQGYLDWMEIQYSRRLNSVTNDFLRINDTNSNGKTIEYRVSSFPNNQARVFNATKHDSVFIIHPLDSSSNIRFQQTQTSLSKYFVVGPGGYKTPTGISGRYPNQNLHGIIDGADFIIISYKDFIPAANRLKQIRETPGISDPNYLKTIVIDVDQIYNEFSGGLLDAVAIRDFICYAYENWTRKPSFVCLFGDGSFDYKNILTPLSNYIPSYEISDPCLNQLNGYAPDDFFVNITCGVAPDLAIGRIPATTLFQANSYIDKIECYEDGNYNGYWKNKIVFVADDGYKPDGNYDGPMHVAQSETLAVNITPKDIEPVKIYLIAYPAVITAEGRRKPEVNADIIKYWNNGCIGLHYIGHGAPDVWANEYVLQKDAIVPQLNNICRYPFLSVASCDFGKFDNPLATSGAEDLMIAEKRGSIGTLAASRPTEGQANAGFMETFWNLLYSQTDTLLLRMRFGTVLFQTKQMDTSANDFKFVLLCDPTIRTRIPRFRSRIDSISGLAGDTMRALSKIKIYGSTMKPDSSLWSDYNGKINMKIFDVQRNVTMTDEKGFVFNFVLPGGIIFSGTQNIKSGLWSIEYVVPKDISYQNRNGKLINYFYNNSFDGSGVYNNFIVGGIDPSAPPDTIGPIINLYLNNHNFHSGDVVSENFILMADLFDEFGINTTGTIGHKIEGIMNNDMNNKIDMTSYYNSDTTYKSGHLSYPFSGVASGKYNLKLRAWDTYNNPSVAGIDFIVALSSALQVMNVYNFPNPFKDKTVFTFQHNYPNTINVRIKVYTVSGRLIKEIDQYNIADKFVAINWDGHDADGDRISNGVYIYKLTVDTDNGKSTINTGKLAVLR